MQVYCFDVSEPFSIYAPLAVSNHTMPHNVKTHWLFGADWSCSVCTEYFKNIYFLPNVLGSSSIFAQSCLFKLQANNPCTTERKQLGYISTKSRKKTAFIFWSIPFCCLFKMLDGSWDTRVYFGYFLSASRTSCPQSFILPISVSQLPTAAHTTHRQKARCLQTGMAIIQLHSYFANALKR